MIRLNEFKGIEVDDYFYDAYDLEGLFRLQSALFKEKKIIATIEECINIWHNHSSDLAAGWLNFPENYILMSIESQYQFTSFEEYAQS
jgi:hypothetical protein